MCQPDSLRRRACADDAQGEICVEKKEKGTGATGYTLTRRTVSFHNLPNDAWVIYKSSVYDITLFLSSHPGGVDELTPYLGKDITEFMNGSHVHSAYAYKLLGKYEIGRVADANVADGNVGEGGVELVRWDRPILHQVGMLGESYFQWIHSFPTTDHTVKMFTNDFVEGLTKCPWYVPLFVWIPVICMESWRYIGMMGGVFNLNLAMIFVVGLFGGLCWLLFEYTLHRYVFHYRTSGYYANILHFLLHGHHHITPMDFDRLVFPPVPAMLLGAPFYFGAPKILGVEKGYPWLIGFAIGYLVYDMTHFWIHHGVPVGSGLKRQKRRHVHHHYFAPDVNFGISNALFDYVFATIREPEM